MIVSGLNMVIEGTIIGFLASIPLGPIGVICIRRTLNGTRNIGFVSGLGAATADTIFALLAVFAVSYVTSFLEGKEMWINAIGGILVMVLGFSIFMKRVDTSRALIKTETSNANPLRSYLSILLLTITNPTYFFVFMSLFTAAGIDVTTNTLANNSLLILGIAIGTSTWWFFLTWIVNKIRSKFTMRSLWWLNKISGGVIILLGAMAIISMLFK